MVNTVKKVTNNSFYPKAELKKQNAIIGGLQPEVTEELLGF
jgi:hypothetical protein